MYDYDMAKQEDTLLFSVEELRAWAEQHPEVVARFEKARGKHARRRYSLTWWYNKPADKIICLLVRGGEIVSTAQTLFESLNDTSIVSVESVWTHPEYRRKGYARQCLQALLAQSVRHRHVDVFVIVPKINQRGPIDLYKSLGFTKLARWPQMYSDIYQLEMTAANIVNNRAETIISLLRS